MAETFARALASPEDERAARAKEGQPKGPRPVGVDGWPSGSRRHRGHVSDDRRPGHGGGPRGAASVVGEAGGVFASRGSSWPDSRVTAVPAPRRQYVKVAPCSSLARPPRDTIPWSETRPFLHTYSEAIALR